MPDRLSGRGVSPGIGVGPVRAIAGAVPEPPAGQRHQGDAGAETRRALDALEAVAADLEERGEKAGGEAKDVLVAQALMARDPGLAELAGQKVAGGSSAARAVYEAFGVFRELLAGAGDYIAARVADLDDIRDRAVAVLLGVPMPGVPDSAEPFVLVAPDLAPADTALLDPAKVVGFVTEEGGPTSHTAILARAMGVPAVVACPGCTALAEGTVVLVDGASGEVRPDPPEEEVARARTESAKSAFTATGPGATSDGHAVPLLANVGGPQDVPAALANGAEGVGLFRTEFLFLDRTTPPGEDEQEAAYRAVLAAFPYVVVRTLDAGADKPLAFLAAAEEPNPALGERGLRMSRRHPEVLQAQLRALARAARDLPVELRAMAPMVADAEEAAFFAEACHAAGIAHAGVMIEIPAAALRARDLAAEADFFSVGTNDLAQYAFAADRQVGALGGLQDPWQPALLDLVALAAEGGRPCGVCGEAAGDPALACVLTGLGITSLSMSPPALPAVRTALAAHTADQCRRAASAARTARSAAGARERARAELPGLSALGL
ncbi:phosphoenolpyruvate--protein phosphotransferase [Actinomadura sp. DC4]|uniref:phosphoenolpyruvate--protein phosphotransferase n=1 Tax=Actinomadura sp. DC4 TaxID=3055069 RepID=UPI0025B1B8E9|nr:phosphoenolpyruvate--protein phosphotransferase [Actinomadura sp. DC4]MDN3355564.1 phosphoenolpyruvate--protein phosphotransferase [Actinomadura sp. DC4]